MTGRRPSRLRPSSDCRTRQAWQDREGPGVPVARVRPTCHSSGTSEAGWNGGTHDSGEAGDTADQRTVRRLPSRAARVSAILAAMSSQRFRATLQLHGRTATGIAVPPEVVQSLGAGRRPPVRVTLHTPDGPYSYRSTVAPMGGEHLVGVSAEHRTAAGVSAGDELDVELEHDTEPRVVEVPRDLSSTLAADPDAQRFFEGLSYSHQRAYTTWVEDAKKPETRARRVSQATGMLHDGKRR